MVTGGGACVAMLAGCALLPQPEILPQTQTVPADFPGAGYACTGSGAVFAVTNSHTLIKTYRAGWLKSLAHNHVITTNSVRGFVYQDTALGHSYADLYFRPIDLELDDPAVRAAAGPGFESTRTPEDIAATRARMLGPRLLASNDYPFVRIHVEPGEHRQSASLRINFRGRDHHLVVPLNWSVAGDKLQVDSSFELTHKDLGIRPYSAFAYALGVADAVAVSIRLEAARGSCPA